ncbi:MAG: 4-(cytidine 5'-diphospho)-2-C-methyl-D-erythritol kinase [Lachnospiraceae bacterium]|nr:4-(cytidine 5'-diphospho)-2-C-methyl-D-erythritol kinase [Lachnospiraceae bacterium]
MENLVRKAYGKINLGLDVLRKRPDGYHDVRMIMQTVDLCDTLTFVKRGDDKIVLTSNKRELPNDENNLIYKAAKLLFSYKQMSGGVSIHLVKTIPIAAGMAGGSADAAATLCGLNDLFELGLSTEELLELGVQIGADVPFCIVGGCALSEGIGEVLTPLVNSLPCELVLAKPDIDVSTKYVYEHLRLDELEHHPDIDGIRRAMESGDLGGMCSLLENVLETVTAEKYEVIGELKRELLHQGAENAVMSGSGPTVFGLFAVREQAEAAKKAILEKQLAKEVFVSRFMNAQES